MLCANQQGTEYFHHQRQCHLWNVSGVTNTGACFLWLVITVNAFKYIQIVVRVPQWVCTMLTKQEVSISMQIVSLATDGTVACMFLYVIACMLDLHCTCTPCCRAAYRNDMDEQHALLVPGFFEWVAGRLFGLQMPLPIGLLVSRQLIKRESHMTTAW